MLKFAALALLSLSLTAGPIITSEGFCSASGETTIFSSSGSGTCHAGSGPLGFAEFALVRVTLAQSILAGDWIVTGWGEVAASPSHLEPPSFPLPRAGSNAEIIDVIMTEGQSRPGFLAVTFLGGSDGSGALERIGAQVAGQSYSCPFFVGCNVFEQMIPITLGEAFAIRLLIEQSVIGTGGGGFSINFRVRPLEADQLTRAAMTSIATPEPSTWLLMAAGVAGIVLLRNSRSKE